MAIYNLKNNKQTNTKTLKIILKDRNRMNVSEIDP